MDASASPLFRMAISLARADHVEARTVLTSLTTVQPDRLEATQALRELAPRMP